MKGFFRRTAGKTLLFISIMLSLLIFCGSVLAAYAMVEFDVYTSSKEDVTYSAIKWHMIGDINSIIRGLFTERITVDDLENTNLCFVIFDKEDRLWAQKGVSERKYSYNLKTLTDTEGNLTDVYISESEDYDYRIDVGFTEGLPENDYYRLVITSVSAMYYFRYSIYLIMFASLLFAVICYIALMKVSGRRPQSDELFPGALNRVPTDLLIALCFAALAFEWRIFVEEFFFHNGFLAVVGVIIVAISTVAFFIGLSMSLAVRIKEKSIFKNTVIYRIVKLIVLILKKVYFALKRLAFLLIDILRNISLVWKTALVLLFISAVEFVFLASFVGGYRYSIVLIGWFWEKVFLTPIILYAAISLRRLQKGGMALAKGDLGHKINTDFMIWDFKKHGENLNNIGSGMTVAVEERLKSERMKTELITNVSHDIKTPLTSIINYSALISGEETENEKIKEYSEVLTRQSERLKRLIDDLVEASKASTGNIDVLLERCEAQIFISQASGEYEEKLNDLSLELMVKMPDTPIAIMADGRRMWRIFDNLMNNVCKYAQSGTRVYLSLEKEGNDAVITFKNTSREALDISEDELMERFVRVDRSRITEGNGLGLSIAKSLVELQNGRMKLMIDGDLFKVELRFPAV